jgi:hypothetical protein
MTLHYLLSQTRRASRLRVKQIASASKARDQHISWIRQSNKEEEAAKEILRIDPIVRPKAYQVKSSLEYVGPNAIPERKTRSESDNAVTEEVLLRDILEPSFKNEMGSIDLGPFGRISVSHGDIFQQHSGSVTVFPVPPNLMPYRGLSLAALENGGDNLLRELFATARALYSEHIISPVADSDESAARQRKPPNRGLPLGSVIPVDESLFVVVPFFWQGSGADANQRLRHALKQVVNHAIQSAEQPVKRLVIPHLGRGVYGYEADWSTGALVEEAIECLLQLDAPEAIKTQLTEIVFIDNDLSVAEEFKDAIDVLADRWLPERRLISAPQYLSQVTRRMIVMDEQSELSTMRRRDKYKFKQYHGRIGNRGGRYFRETLQPWIWRTQKLLEPPPLMINEQTGHISEKQLPARPYFFRGLSHTLFPTGNLKTGFPALRRSGSGQLRGVNRQPDTQKLAKPRT